MTTRSPSPLQATSSHAGWIRVTSLSTALFLLLSFAAFSGFKDVFRGDNIISASKATGLRPYSLQGHSHDDNVIHSASDDGTYHHRHHHFNYHQRVESFSENETTSSSPSSSSFYFVFLQKFPLESTFRMIFHTEVVVCPRDAFSDDLSFLDTLDDLASSLSPPEAAAGNEEEIISARPMIHQRRNPPQPRGKHFAQVPKSQWSSQSNPRCTQLGYGGSSCTDRCCSVPHRGTNYPLDSKQAVIGNAMGEYKELYLYGVSDVDAGGLSGEDAYRAVCRRDDDDDVDDGDDDTLPKCVSDWAGTDYNPLTNNCNTFTSTVLKCVFGLSDDKPDLGVSDLVTVECPEERRSDGGSGNGWDLVKQCLVPDRQAERGGLHGPSDAGKSELLDLQR